MLSRVTIAGAAIVVLSLSSPLPVSADSSGSPQDPALSQYVEQIPSAGKNAAPRGPGSPTTRARAALPANVADALARQGHTGQTLKQVATSPGLGAPTEALDVPTEVKPGSDDATKTFSLATVRSVAGVGGTRLVGLLVVIVLVSVAFVANVFSRSARR